MAVNITGKPDKKVTSLKAPARGSGNRKMSTTWKVPAAMTKSTYNKRAEELEVSWKLDITGKKNIKLSKDKSTSTTSAEINLNNFTVGSKSYNRNSFYPNSDVKLYSVTIKVKGKNSKGKGDAVTNTREFDKPKAPTIDAFSFNTGTVSTVIRTDAGAEYKERYDTKYSVTVVNTRTGQTTSVANTSSTSTEINVSYDASDYMNLSTGQYIKVEVKARARGFAGDSGEVTKAYYVSYPAKATIGKLRVTSKDYSTGKLIVPVTTNSRTEHPVDTVKLEYLANVTYENASDIPPNTTAWEDSGIEDNGNCTAFSIPISGLVPDRGKYTWIRVKTIHAYEEVLYQYSDYARVKDLETQLEESDNEITILSVASGADAKSAVVHLGWNRSGTDEATGTELSWSDEEDTWKSTKDPEHYEFTWSDGSVTEGGITYHDSATITIKDLNEGQLYYIKARRYYEEETTSYGGYSEKATVIPNGKPAGVVANCKGEIADGEPLQVYWSFGGAGLQTAWEIVDSSDVVIAKGEGSITGTQISADVLKSYAVNNSVTFRVGVSTGSEYTASAYRTVTIRQKPTLTISSNATLTAQPFSFTATSSRLCDLIVIVTAQGISGQRPEGVVSQLNGDTVHSNKYTPTWTNGSTTVTLPVGLDLWDGGDYTLSVVAVDRETGLRSEEATTTFSVNWATKAKNPDGFVTITPVDTVSEGNEHIQGVQIALTPPTGSASTDVYDIYRMDGGKAHRISVDTGFPLTKTFIDEYAPFSDNGELFYRVAIRTADGDVDFADIPYTLISDTVRFDWEGGTLELPYGITIGDNYKKDVEFRQHMDGSVDGYWNQNITRGASYSSAIIKLIQPNEINLARQLARYAGAVFVRTANGSAFTADVQVTDLSVKNEAVTAIAIDATEVGLTEEFMLTSPYEQAG